MGIAFTVAVIVLALAAWRPFEMGTLFWVGGPLFGSSFSGVLPGLNLDQLLSLVGTGFLGVAALRNKTRLQASSPTFLAIAMTMSVSVSALINGGAGGESVVRFASTTIASLILISAAPKYPAFLAHTLVACSSGAALILVAQRYTGWPAPYATREGFGLRYGGLVGHPNFAAYSLGTAALAIFVMARTKRDYAPLFVLIPAIVLTGSRTAMIFFLVALIGYAALRRPKSLVWLGLAGASLLPISQTLVSRFQSVSDSGGVSGDNAAGWRLEQWQRSWQLGEGSRGLGIGWQKTYELLPQNLGVHNLYLEVAVELGYLGVACLTIGIAAMAIGARRNAVRLVTLLFVLGASISDPTLLYPPVLAVIVLVWAVDQSGDAPIKTINPPPLRRRANRSPITTTTGSSPTPH